jgi:hypothetical protein
MKSVDLSTGINTKRNHRHSLASAGLEERPLSLEILPLQLRLLSGGDPARMSYAALGGLLAPAETQKYSTASCVYATYIEDARLCKGHGATVGIDIKLHQVGIKTGREAPMAS